MAWKVWQVMLSNDFKVNKVNECVYMRNINRSHVIIYLSMDDMLILDSNKYIIKSMKMLTNKFDMKDLSVTNDILEIKISRIFNNKYMIKSTKKMLTNKFDMKDMIVTNEIL
jgi:hypothetical protein